MAPRDNALNPTTPYSRLTQDGAPQPQSLPSGTPINTVITHLLKKTAERNPISPDLMLPISGRQDFLLHFALATFCVLSTATYYTTGLKASPFGTYDAAASVIPRFHYFILACTLLSAGQVLYNTFPQFLARQFHRLPNAIKSEFKNPPTFEKQFKEFFGIFVASAFLSIPIALAYLLYPISWMPDGMLWPITIFLLVINAFAHMFPIQLMNGIEPFDKPGKVLSSAFSRVFYYEETREIQNRKAAEKAFQKKIIGKVIGTLRQILAETLKKEYTSTLHFSWWRLHKIWNAEYTLQKNGLIENAQHHTLKSLLNLHAAQPQKAATQSKWMTRLTWFIGGLTITSCAGYMLLDFEFTRSNISGLGWKILFYGIGVASAVVFSALLIWIGQGGSQNLYNLYMSTTAYNEATEDVKTNTSPEPLAAKLNPKLFFCGTVINVPFILCSPGSANKVMEDAAKALLDDPIFIYILTGLATLMIEWLITTTAFDWLGGTIERCANHSDDPSKQKVMVFVRAIQEIIAMLEREDFDREAAIEELNTLNTEELKALGLEKKDLTFTYTEETQTTGTCCSFFKKQSASSDPDLGVHERYTPLLEGPELV